MLLTLFLFLIGLGLLVVGGDLLVRGSVRVAERLGMSDLLVGLVLVGFGTSSPELFASIEAVRVGSPEIAWGNVVGSNIANVLLILGAAALIAPYPVARGPLWRDGGAGLIAAALLFVFALGGVSGLEGGVLLAALIGYLLYAYLSERRASQSTGLGDKAAGFELVDTQVHSRGRSAAWLDALLLIGGLALIIGGGTLLIDAAREIALSLGMSETLVGLTVVAIGTSAPELATSVIAARKGEGDIAFGNVVGSNIYNILAIGGVTAVLAPGSLPLSMTRLELPLLVAAALVLLVVARTGYRFSRWEGAVLVLGYAAYLALTISAGT